MLRSGSLLVLVAGLALCLDLENLQRSSHFPGSFGPSAQQGQQHHYGASKRTSVPRRDPEEFHGRTLVAPSSSSSPEERLYYRLLSSRMARLLPALLGEQPQQEYPGEAPLVSASSFFDDDSDGERDDGRDAGRAAGHGGVANEDAGEEDQGDEQEADQVMMYLPKRRVVHSTAGSIRRRLQEPLFGEMNPSGAVYGIRKRVAPFKRRLHVQVARQDEKRKRSTRRQLKDASSPFRRKTLKKAFGKKQTSASALKEHNPSSTTSSFRSAHQGSGKGSVVPTVVGNATLHKADTKSEGKTSAVATSSGGSKKKYHIMKRSSYSTDDKVTGELRNIFGDDEDDHKKRDKKTLKKRENTVGALKGSSGVDDASSAVSVGGDGAAPATKSGAGTSTDEDKFKKWLLDEYYRTMALSFASMRRKRMATHQDTLDLRQVKRTALPPSAPVSGTADDQFQAVEDKLRSIEDTMIGEAVALVRDGASDEAELRAINAGVASRLDAAYDLENVRQSLDHLQSTLEDMRRQELQAALAADGDETEEEESSSAAAASGVLRNDATDIEELAQGSSWAQLTDKQSCPAVQVLSSSCPAAAQSASPVPAMQRILLDACEWQQTCYVCGSYYGLGAEDCEGGAGGSHGSSSQFTRLLVSQLLLHEAKNAQTQAACAESCVAEFLLSH